MAEKPQPVLRRFAIVLASASLALTSNLLMAQPESNKSFPDQAYVLPVAGQDVPVSEGLQSVLPEGWYFYIKPSTRLPANLNWKAGDNWTSILDSLAHDNGLSVNINWADKGVIISAAEKSTVTSTLVSTTANKPQSQVPPILSNSVPLVVTPPAAATSPALTPQAEPSIKPVPADKPRVASQASIAATTAPVVTANPQVARSEAPRIPQAPSMKSVSTTRAIELSSPEERPVFDVKTGQNLRTALSSWLRTQGYSVEWTAPQNPVFSVAHHYEGESVTEMLGELLLPLGMRAEVYFIGESGKKIVIKQTSN